MPTREPEPAVPGELAPLDAVQRARDLLVGALADMPEPTFEQVEALASLNAECQARAAGTQADALDQLVFRWRQRQAQREALVAQVRRLR
jgi:hypothetical protein